MPGLFAKIFASGAEGILKGASDILDKVITNKEEVLQAKTELQKVVNEHSARMEELAVRADENYLSDIASARAMNIEAIKSSDKFIRRFPYYLAGGMITAVVGIVVLIIMGEIPKEKENMIFTIVGLLGGSMTTIIAFFFGSSKSSQSKDDTIKSMVSGDP